MEAIILAGGLGTRLKTRLSNLPKAMAPINGRPFLEFLLDQLVEAGFNRVILSVGHLRNCIIETFQTSYRGLTLEYVIEESPLGTGGAIRLALNSAHEDSALVLNGDTYLDADFPAMMAAHDSSGRPITVAVTRVDDMRRYGGVMVEQGKITGFVEKGRTGNGLINAGAYILKRDFPWPEGLPSQFSFETDVLSPCIGSLSPAAFLCMGKFLDIGVPEDLDSAQFVLKLGNRNPVQ